MDNLMIFGSIVLGVIISIILPILRVLLPEAERKAKGLSKTSNESKFWKIIRPYIIIGIFSIFVALLIMAFAGDLIDSWQNGLLAGYTSDSTLQKLKAPNNNEE